MNVCLQPIKGDHGHYCHKTEGHGSTCPVRVFNGEGKPRVHPQSCGESVHTHVCNCHGMPTDDARKCVK